MTTYTLHTKIRPERFVPPGRWKASRDSVKLKATAVAALRVALAQAGYSRESTIWLEVSRPREAPEYLACYRWDDVAFAWMLSRGTDLAPDRTLPGIWMADSKTWYRRPVVSP